MSTMIKLPEFQDEVKHKTADMTGVVIAKYPRPNMTVPGNPQLWALDIRRADEVIEYNSPAENWEIVRTAYERGQV